MFLCSRDRGSVLGKAQEGALLLFKPKYQAVLPTAPRRAEADGLGSAWVGATAARRRRQSLSNSLSPPAWLWRVRDAP
jgi:hypothetical protein